MSKNNQRNVSCKEAQREFFLSMMLAIALAISAVAAIAAGSAGSADDACIISDGTAGTGINTGFFYDSDSRIEIDYAFMSTDRPMMRLFGRDYTSPRVSFCVYNGNGAFVFDNADHTAVHYGTTGLAADTSRHTIIVDQPNRKAYFISDCVTNATVTIPSTPTAKAERPIALFGVTDTVGLTVTFESGSATSYRSSTARIYRAKFWKGDTLVVSGAFLTAENNTQLAAFSASPETPSVPDDGYVSTPGNNSGAGEKLYFDTGYVPNDRTRVELDFAQCESYPEAGYSGNHNWFLFYAADAFNMYYNKNGMGWSAGNSWKGFTPGVTAARIQDKDVRRTAILDMKNLSAPASLVTVGYTNCVSSSAGAGINISTSLAIAANRTGGSAGALKIYGCRIFEDGSPVHSFEPYVKDGIAGLLDTIGDKGFISAPIATNALKIVAGGSIASAPGWRDAYIESDGTQSIDTGITLGANMRTEIDFQHLTGTAVGRRGCMLCLEKVQKKRHREEISGCLETWDD